MAHDRIRVLQLIKSLDHGGAERLLAQLVTKMENSPISYEVAFVRSDLRSLVDELQGAGVPVHDLGARGDFQVSWMARLRRLLLAERYDVMHAHSPYAAGLARIVTRTMRPGRRPRLVYTEHSRWDHNTTASRWLGRTTSHWDDVRIAVAEANRAALPPALRRGTRVMPHGIDLERVVAESRPDDVRASLGIPPDHHVVVSVANLTRQKAYPTLLSATRILLDAGLPVTLLAAGAGPLEADLRAEHARLGLGDRFRFLGQRADARSLIAASDVLVLSSDWESMPVVVMEAFALGTPVVATSVGELPMVIQNGVNGLLVPPSRPDLLAAALERVLTDPALRAALGRAGAATAGRFDLRRSRAEVETVYAELVAR